MHTVAMAALGGYHLFSIMQGHPFDGIDEGEFVQMLARMEYPDTGKPASVGEENQPPGRLLGSGSGVTRPRSAGLRGVPSRSGKASVLLR